MGGDPTVLIQGIWLSKQEEQDKKRTNSILQRRQSSRCNASTKTATEKPDLLLKNTHEQQQTKLQVDSSSGDSDEEYKKYKRELRHERSCKVKTVQLIPYRWYDRNVNRVNDKNYVKELEKYIEKNRNSHKFIKNQSHCQ